MRAEVGGFYTSAVIPAEDEILSELVRPGAVVLDVGCGSGRSARKLLALTANVWAIDFNLQAVRDLGRKIHDESALRLANADMRRLPFADESFDLVLIALCGLDYLTARPDRVDACREFERVLRRGGHCVFSSHNPVGVVFSPRGMNKLWNLKWRLRHILSGRFLRDSFPDGAGILLRQALPRTVIKEVCSNSGLKFVTATNKTATTRRLMLLTLLSAWPHYVFVKT